MKISTILAPNTILVGLKVSNKSDLINALVNLANSTGKITDVESVRSEVIKREDIMSTGIGNGIALPHAKTNSVSDTICAIALLDSPIDYNAIDGEPISIAFLLLGRENNVGTHLRILSRISRFLSNEEKLNALKNCKSSDEVFKVFVDID